MHCFYFLSLSQSETQTTVIWNHGNITFKLRQTLLTKCKHHLLCMNKSEMIKRCHVQKQCCDYEQHLYVIANPFER